VLPDALIGAGCAAIPQTDRTPAAPVEVVLVGSGGRRGFTVKTTGRRAVWSPPGPKGLTLRASGKNVELSGLPTATAIVQVEAPIGPSRVRPSADPRLTYRAAVRMARGAPEQVVAKMRVPAAVLRTSA
jgi:hypothetical protein